MEGDKFDTMTMELLVFLREWVELGEEECSELGYEQD